MHGRFGRMVRTRIWFWADRGTNNDCSGALWTHILNWLISKHVYVGLEQGNGFRHYFTSFSSPHVQSLYFKANWYIFTLTELWLYDRLKWGAYARSLSLLNLLPQNLSSGHCVLSWILSKASFLGHTCPSSWVIVIPFWTLAWQYWIQKLGSSQPALRSLAVTSSNGDTRLWSY